MKRNNELERSDIAIDRDMEVDCDKGQQITCYVETWFDVDKKFRIHTDADAGTWLNMYARYDPYEDTLRIDCVISSDVIEFGFQRLYLFISKNILSCDWIRIYCRQ